ncbi:MAG: hypothetical protein GY953_51185, partial [bacterium]|nr:hypothetical protein [bacterium]
SVAPALTGMRLVEDMLNGGGLDFYMIGRLENQEDRLALSTVKDVFRFHQSNERWFTNVKSNADVLLVRGAGRAGAEYRGFMRILGENHVVFDAMEAWMLDSRETPKPLEDYKLVILPDVANLSDAACKRLDEYVKAGGRVLATGYTSTNDEIGNPRNRFRLEAAGVSGKYKVHEKARGTYLRIFPEDKRVLRRPSLEELDLVYIWGDFLEHEPRDGAKGFGGLIPAAMYGPPEKCYYTDVTRIPGLISNQYGKGRFAYIPWPVGKQYDYRSQHGHSMVAMAAIND